MITLATFFARDQYVPRRTKHPNRFGVSSLSTSTFIHNFAALQM